MLGLGLGAWCACLCKRQMSGNVCTVVRRMVAAARGGGGFGIFQEVSLFRFFSLPCRLFVLFQSRTLSIVKGCIYEPITEFLQEFFGHS